MQVVVFLGIHLSQTSRLKQSALLTDAEITSEGQFLCFYLPERQFMCFSLLQPQQEQLSSRNPIKASGLHNAVSRTLTSISFPVSQIELF